MHLKHAVIERVGRRRTRPGCFWSSGCSSGFAEAFVPSFNRTCAALLYTLMYGKWGRRWAEREKCAFCWRYSRSPVVPRTCKYVFSSQHVYVPWRRDRYHLWDAGGNKLHQAVRQFVFLYVLYVLNYHWKVWIGPGYVLGRLRVIFACFPGVYFRQRWSPEHSCVNKCINSIFGTLCHSDSKYLTLLTAHKVQIHTESCQTQLEIY